MKVSLDDLNQANSQIANIYELDKLAQIYEDGHEVEQAIFYLQQILKLRPKDTQVGHRLANAIELYFEKGHFDDAIRNYHQLLIYLPDSKFILNKLSGLYKKLYLQEAQVVLDTNENLEELIQICKNLIESSHTSAEGYFGMGHILIAQRKWEEAIDCFLETLKRNLCWNQVYESLAYVLRQQGNYKLEDIRLCCEKYIIPKTLIKRICDLNEPDFITSRELANDLKYIEVEETFSSQKTDKGFVVILNHGRACRGRYKDDIHFAISSNNKLVQEVSRASSKQILYTKTLVPTREFDGTVAYFVAGPALWNIYYHWMLQVIPQFLLLRHAGINTDEIDKFVFFRKGSSSNFQKETLDLLGISLSKIIGVYNNPHIKAKKLIVTSLFPTMPPSKLACNLTRSELLNHKSLESLSKSDRPNFIYISRKNASYRKITNENQLISLLENYGFIPIYLECLTVLEQVDLFSAAKVIISPHGSGLTNLLFCQPGTKVIEIFPKSYKNYRVKMYEQICSHLSLEYYSLIAKDIDMLRAEPRENFTAEAWREKRKREMYMNVNLNSLSDLMKLAEII